MRIPCPPPPRASGRASATCASMSSWATITARPAPLPWSTAPSAGLSPAACGFVATSLMPVASQPSATVAPKPDRRSRGTGSTRFCIHPPQLAIGCVQHVHTRGPGRTSPRTARGGAPRGQDRAEDARNPECSGPGRASPRCCDGCHHSGLAVQGSSHAQPGDKRLTRKSAPVTFRRKRQVLEESRPPRRTTSVRRCCRKTDRRRHDRCCRRNSCSHHFRRIQRSI